MDVQRFTSAKLSDDLKSRSYLAILVMVVGVVLGMFKDYPTIIAENRWSQFFGGFELTIVGAVLFIALRQQIKALDGLCVELHDGFIRLYQSGKQHDFHRGRSSITTKATSIELRDDDHIAQLDLSHFGDFKQRRALKNAVEEWGKG
jgi:hypothetical protein